MTLLLPTDQPDAVSRVPLHIRLSAWMIDRARRCHRARWEAHNAETAARFPPPPLQPLAAQPSISSVRPLSGDQPLEFGADQKIVSKEKPMSKETERSSASAFDRWKRAPLSLALLHLGRALNRMGWGVEKAGAWMMHKAVERMVAREGL
jgi:hypothetical protein